MRGYLTFFIPLQTTDPETQQWGESEWQPLESSDKQGPVRSCILFPVCFGFFRVLRSCFVSDFSSAAPQELSASSEFVDIDDLVDLDVVARIEEAAAAKQSTAQQNTTQQTTTQQKNTQQTTHTEPILDGSGGNPNPAIDDQDDDDNTEILEDRKNKSQEQSLGRVTVRAPASVSSPAATLERFHQEAQETYAAPSLYSPVSGRMTTPRRRPFGNASDGGAETAADTAAVRELAEENGRLKSLLESISQTNQDLVVQNDDLHIRMDQLSRERAALQEDKDGGLRDFDLLKYKLDDMKSELDAERNDKQRCAQRARTRTRILPSPYVL